MIEELPKKADVHTVGNFNVPVRFLPITIIVSAADEIWSPDARLSKSLIRFGRRTADYNY